MRGIRHEIKQSIKYWMFPVLRPRRFHAYGVGIAKSGTSSMNGLFRRYRSLHEPEREQFMAVIMAAAQGSLSNLEARARVRWLNRRLWLEFNSSWLNYFMLDMLLDEYPHAKFILTIRDCYSWLDSSINHLLARKHEPYQENFHSWYANCFELAPHRDEERALADEGLYPLAGWLTAWNRHNATVLAKVPPERLLVVRTQDIRRDCGRIADFLGIPSKTLDPSRSHLYKAEKKFGLLAKINRGFLHEKVQEQCGDLMKRYFPEIRTLDDVEGYRRVPEETHDALRSGNGRMSMEVS